jgi:hypothetical protein
MILTTALCFLAFTLLLYLAERFTRIPVDVVQASPVKIITRGESVGAGRGRTYTATDAMIPEIWAREALMCLMSNTITKSLVNRK